MTRPSDDSLANLTPQSRRTTRLAAALVVLITLGVYLPAVFNEFVQWDDALFITANPLFNPPTFFTLRYYATHAGFNLYMPATYFFWALLAKLGAVHSPDAMGAQLNPYIFHLASVLLHVIATLAVFGLLQRIVKRALPAAIGASLFALHPLQVESVAFIGTMNTPLAAALLLPACWLTLRSIDRGQPWHSPPRLFATALYALALLSKPTAVVGPALLMLLELASPPRPRSLRRALLHALPWIILTIPAALLAMHIQAAAASLVPGPLWTRPFIAADAMTFYLRKLVIPWPLAIDYGQTPTQLLHSHSIWWLWILPAGLLLFAWLVRHRSPLLAIGVALFFVGWLPNSGLVPFEYQFISTVADRYVYLAMLGPALVLAALLAARPSHTIAIAAAILLLPAIALTELQIRTWQDGEHLFRHAIAVNPRSWMSRSDLAIVLASTNPLEAITQARQAVELNPSSWNARNNLASLLARRDPDEAIAQARLAIKLNPRFADAFNNLGTALTARGDLQSAAAAFNRAAALAPSNAIIQENARGAAAREARATSPR